MATPIDRAVFRIARELRENDICPSVADEQARAIARRGAEIAKEGGALGVDEVTLLLRQASVTQDSANEIVRLWIAETSKDAFCAWARLQKEAGLAPGVAAMWLRFQGYTPVVRPTEVGKTVH